MMLIKALLDLIYTLLDFVLFVELPAMPDFISEILGQFLNYILMGLSVLRSFIGISAMNVLGGILVLIVSFNLFYLAWSMVFWILRKIPMLNIKE